MKEVNVCMTPKHTSRTSAASGQDVNSSIITEFTQMFPRRIALLLCQRGSSSTPPSTLLEVWIGPEEEINDRPQVSPALIRPDCRRQSGGVRDVPLVHSPDDDTESNTTELK